MNADDDDARVRLHQAEVANDLEAAQAGQRQIENDEVPDTCLTQRDGLFAVSASATSRSVSALVRMRRIP